jgi:DNA-directed RNA polymerase subunit RPC12/RpoP
MFTTTKRFHCAECLHTWGLERGTARPTECPQCRSRNLHRAAEDRGCARLDVATRSSSCPRSRRFGKQSP